jgi:hypothetical protein
MIVSRDDDTLHLWLECREEIELHLRALRECRAPRVVVDFADEQRMQIEAELRGDRPTPRRPRTRRR